MYPRRLAAGTALALVSVSISPVIAHAATAGTYYVARQSSACTDLGPGTQAEPFCTIQQAASTATVAGDTVLIEPGSYSDEVDVTASGTAAAPITFASTSAGGVSMGPLVLKGASYVDVTGLGIAAASTSTATVAVTGASSHDVLSKLTVDGPSSGSAIDIDASGTGNVVTTSQVTDAKSSGITVLGSAYAVITSNTVYGYCGNGIAIGDDSNGTAFGATIENNVIAEAYTTADPYRDVACPSADAVGLSVQTAADDNGITSDYNSVYPDLTSTASAVYSWAGTTYSTPAALQAQTGQGAHDSIADPDIYYGGGIAGESSPLVNSANASAPDEQATDIDGNARIVDPNVPETGAGTAGYDRGAFQFLETIGMLSPSMVATAPSGAAITVTASAAKSNWANATFTYKYDFGDGISTTSSSLTMNHTYTTPGTYTVTVTAISGYGGTNSEHTSITILKPVTFGVSLAAAPDYGTGVGATVTVTTDWPMTSGQVKFGDGKTPQDLAFTASGSTATATANEYYPKAGTYTVTATVADANGDTQTVTRAFTTKGTDFTPYGPARLLDTRKGLGGTSSQLANDGSIKLKIAGSGAIPTGVTAVALNLTAVNANGGGFIQADTGTDTGTSTVNYNTGPVYSNAVIAQVASDGTVTLRNFGATKAVKLDLIADVTGYFSPTAGSVYNYVAPTRLMDTRKGIGVAKAKLGAGQTDVLTVEGDSPVPATGVTAVSVNITEVNTTGSGYLLAYPDKAPLPNSSTVDWNGATTKAAGAIVPLGSDGKIDIYDGGAGNASADVIVDVTGYFTSTGTGDSYVALAPYRVMDTRKGYALNAGHTTHATFNGIDGLPNPVYPPHGDPIDGYVLNSTVTQTPADGYLLASDSQTPGSTSTVNWTGANQTTANLTFSQAGSTTDANGAGYSSVFFYNGATTGSVQVVADLMGYFTQS